MTQGHLLSPIKRQSVLKPVPDLTQSSLVSKGPNILKTPISSFKVESKSDWKPQESFSSVSFETDTETKCVFGIVDIVKAEEKCDTVVNSSEDVPNADDQSNNQNPSSPSNNGIPMNKSPPPVIQTTSASKRRK